MKIQWEKLPDRLDSEAVKCLLCTIMGEMLEKSNDMTAALSMCCCVMAPILTMKDDGPFESKEKLAEIIAKRTETLIGLDFIKQNTAYVYTCVKRVLDRVKACPDKTHNKARR